MSGGGGGGYRVDPEALERITRGINQATDELKELGFDIEAGQGRGFDELELAGLEVGDAALRETFADFCERWGWGVRSLLQDANEFAGRLNLSAGLYHEQEQYASNTLKTLWTATAGNPSLSQEEVEQRSWSETLKDNPVSHVMNADLSAESMREADAAARQAWAQAGEDVESSTVTPDALFDPRTDWQWDGPKETSFGEVER
ncbi:hypothetical protein QQM39_27750 [Streptomyces sp. DT2A-34]|uniref:hypothetical protein n=1 Tax=Streptomyces sp. DT2A-34 TaxID=3051182 RepID=UPI00265C5592|nr:hypothetical protein [Streptomyces sp. DT2A-34]MDO0914489.1 hypothetical protein [Streptomyces sp. DT2A-34]